MRIAPASVDQRASLIDVAVATSLFTPDEAESLLGGVLDGLASGALPQGHEAVYAASTDGGAPLGWCYFAPDEHAQGVWNLWWIGSSPKNQGSGAGSALLRYFEQRAAGQGARILVVETSDSGALARARHFYAKHGYLECGRVPHFYATSESKVIFSRTVNAA